MPEIIAIQADNLLSLNPKSDSSLYIASEICKRGVRVFFYEPKDIEINQEGLYLAYGKFIDVSHKDNITSFKILEEKLLDLCEVKCIMIRQDPPFDMNYITNSYILENLQKIGIKIVNDPRGIRENSEKLTAFKFKDFMPPSIIVSKFSENVLEFIYEYEEVVLKPLYWFGGRFVRKINKAEDFKSIIEEYLAIHSYAIIQKYLPEVIYGDKRVFIINGKVSGCMRRIPKEGNFIANLAAGGSAHQCSLSFKEREIAEIVGQYLYNQGIIFAGLDMINDHLIEVNVTSPTGLVAMERLYNINLASDIIDRIL